MNDRIFERWRFNVDEDQAPCLDWTGGAALVRRIVRWVNDLQTFLLDLQRLSFSGRRLLDSQVPSCRTANQTEESLTTLR